MGRPDKKLKQNSFVSIPPHVMLPNGTMTQQWHCFWNADHRRFYTLGEAKRVLSERLHTIRGGKHFVQYSCIPNCDLWKVADATMNAGTDRAIALDFSSDGEQIYWTNRQEQELDVRDAIHRICIDLTPSGPTKGRQN